MPVPDVGGWIVDWGDGTSGTTADSGATLAHEYTRADSYTVTATSQDGSVTCTLLASASAQDPNGAVSDDAPPSTIRGVYTFPGDGGNLTLTVHPQGWVKFRVGWGDGTADTYDATWTGADDTQTFTHHYGSLGNAGSLPVSVSFVGVATEHGEWKTFFVKAFGGALPYPTPSGTPSEQWPAPQVVKAGDPVDITATYSNEPITNGQLAYINWDGADWATKLMGAIFDGSGSITAHFDHAPLTTSQPQIFIYADGVSTNPYPTTDWGDGGNGWAGGGGVIAGEEGGNVRVQDVQLKIGSATATNATTAAPPAEYVPLDINTTSNGTPETQVEVPDLSDPALVAGSLSWDLVDSTDATWSLAVPGNLRVFKLTDGVLTPIASGTAYPVSAASSAVSFMVQGIAEGIEVPIVGSVSGMSATVNANTADLLDVQKVLNGNPNGSLPDADKHGAGAFVPLDNNDWDYKWGTDLYQGEAVPGDKYLLPVVLHQIPGATDSDYYILTNTAGINVWHNADRTGLLLGSHGWIPARIHANETTTIYVEGAEDTVIRSHPSRLSLALRWHGALQQNIDYCLINVFDINGCLDVPGNGTYTYRADVPGGAWITPTHGRITWTGTPNGADITWENVAEIGMANYEANANYVWSCPVNIVKITIMNARVFDASYSSAGCLG